MMTRYFSDRTKRSFYVLLISIVVICLLSSCRKDSTSNSMNSNDDSYIDSATESESISENNSDNNSDIEPIAETELSQTANYLKNREIPDYEAYKADLLEEAKIERFFDFFNAENTEGIYTYEVLKGKISDINSEDTLVIYMVVNEERTYPVFTLITDKSVIYQPFEHLWDLMSNATFELVHYTDDEKNSIFVSQPTNGSGGLIEIFAYRYKDGEIKEYLDCGTHDEYTKPFTSFEIELGDKGIYTVINKDTGYNETFTKEQYELFNGYDENGKYVGENSKLDVLQVQAFLWKDIDDDGVEELLVQHTFAQGTQIHAYGYGYEAFRYDPEKQLFKAVKSEFDPIDECPEMRNLDSIW